MGPYYLLTGDNHTGRTVCTTPDLCVRHNANRHELLVRIVYRVMIGFVAGICGMIAGIFLVIQGFCVLIFGCCIGAFAEIAGSCPG